MPPITLDETYHPRPFACDECKAIIGVVMRDVNHHRRLWVFRLSKKAEEMPTKDSIFSQHRYLFSIHGLECASRPGGIECSYCGAITDWMPSNESFEKLMGHFAT